MSEDIDADESDHSGGSLDLPGGLTEQELSALLAVCVVVGVVVWSRPAPLETRVPSLAVALFVTASAFLWGLRRLR